MFLSIVQHSPLHMVGLMQGLYGKFVLSAEAGFLLLQGGLEESLPSHRCKRVRIHSPPQYSLYVIHPLYPALLDRNKNLFQCSENVQGLLAYNQPRQARTRSGLEPGPFNMNPPRVCHFLCLFLLLLMLLGRCLRAAKTLRGVNKDTL